jgi:hypothetical protein
MKELNIKNINKNINKFLLIKVFIMYNLKKNKDTGGIPDTQKNNKIKYNIAFFLEILDNTLLLK